MIGIQSHLSLIFSSFIPILLLPVNAYYSALNIVGCYI